MFSNVFDKMFISFEPDSTVIPMSQIRIRFREVQKKLEENQSIGLTKYNKPFAVIVPVERYQELTKKKLDN